MTHLLHNYHMDPNFIRIVYQLPYGPQFLQNCTKFCPWFGGMDYLLLPWTLISSELWFFFSMTTGGIYYSTTTTTLPYGPQLLQNCSKCRPCTTYYYHEPKFHQNCDFFLSMTTGGIYYSTTTPISSKLSKISSLVRRYVLPWTQISSELWYIYIFFFNDNRRYLLLYYYPNFFKIVQNFVPG